AQRKQSHDDPEREYVNAWHGTLPPTMTCRCGELNTVDRKRPRGRLSGSRLEGTLRHHKRSHARAPGLGLQRGDLVRGIWNAAAAMLRLEPRFRLARDEDLVEAFRLRAGAHALDQRVHAVAILGLGNEQIRPQRQEEMADILRPVIDLVL